MDPTTVLIALLSTGTLVGIVVAVFNYVRDSRSGSRAKVRDVMEDLVRNANSQEERADRERHRANEAENERDNWRAAAARYAMQLIRAGIEPIPPFGEAWPGEPPTAPPKG